MRNFILIILCILLLTGCTPAEPAPTQTPTVAETAPPVTEPPTEVPTEAPTEAVTLPPHSELYIPGVEAEDVITYFNEVCLSAEFVNSGDPSYLQRWNAPITYRIHGDPTTEDLAKIEEFSGWLNTLFGFPGIYEAGEEEYANLRIHFCDQETLIDLMGDNFYGTDGAVTFWYDEDVIYDAIICIRTDLDQYLRNSVILEELYNGLGPVQDTDLRTDSIIYSAYSEPQELTDMDELILKLLYHPELKCGMSAAECEAVIRKLYY